MTKEVEGEEVSLSVDGNRKGNYLRFINHKGDERNSVADYLIHDNLWHVIYVADRDIGYGEELSTNYGNSYFESRM